VVPCGGLSCGSSRRPCNSTRSAWARPSRHLQLSPTPQKWLPGGCSPGPTLQCKCPLQQREEGGGETGGWVKHMLLLGVVSPARCRVLTPLLCCPVLLQCCGGECGLAALRAYADQ